jgi:hypothetical protein
MAKCHTPIVGWFAGHTWENNNKWYTELPKLLFNFYSIYTVYTYGLSDRGLETHGLTPCRLKKRNYLLIQTPRFPNEHCFFGEVPRVRLFLLYVRVICR